MLEERQRGRRLQRWRGDAGARCRDGAWRPKQDDGARIERLTGAGNGDNDGEYWKITTVDGTQYFYGSRPQANSTWTVPVFGDDNLEPCHGATFATSSCTQAWRWNLDKVVDRHGNVMLYTYDVETNAYGLNLRDTAISYVRGGSLKRIEYGLRDDLPNAPAAARVEFGTADRCVPGSTCTTVKTENWPDVPLANKCDTATCHNQYSPTFWTTKRLATITTQVWRASSSSYEGVDRWTLDQQFPDPGDGENAALWLKSITHAGLVGGSIALPPVTFEGAKMPNRVYQVDGIAPLNRYRIVGIVSETGGVTSISYAQPNCVPGTSMPANPETNTLRCFPVRWNTSAGAERTDYFHKYVVAAVASSDRISANPEQQVSYEYLDGAAWHYDDSESTPNDKRSWNEFRGYAKVRIRGGLPNDPSGPVTLTQRRFYRGMDGDHLPSGTRSVTLTDSQGGVHTDHDWLSGFGMESTVHDGDGGPVVSTSISDPVWQGPTATRGTYKAYIVRTGAERTFATLAGGGSRDTKTVTTYDDRGLPTQVDDLGDLGTAADDTCTMTTYVRNTAKWLLSFPSRVETVSVNCATTPTFPDDAVADQWLSYEQQAPGDTPTAGDVTKVEDLDQHPASGPVYKVTATTAYDAHGRVTEVRDALDRTTRIAYTPALGGPTTQVVTTDPANFAATTTMEPAWGVPTQAVDANARLTETAFDALGRVTEVWRADRPRTGSQPYSGNYKFSYLVRNDAPTVVTTMAIGPNGNYASTNTLYDGLLRARQVQAPAVGGGRLLTDTRYDSQGRGYKTTRPYFNDAPVDTKLWVAADADVPGLTVSEHDGAGRVTAQIFKGGGVEQWRTILGYDGDRIDVTPPAGGTATTTIFDARGQTTELRQYHGGTPSDSFDATTYAYTPAGQLARMTDAANNTWRYTYDLHGRQTRVDDPDKGVSTMTYDAAGQLRAVSDARSITLAYNYDALGRKLSERSGGPTGPLLAQWTYDTAIAGKGMPATATRLVDGIAYVNRVVAYTAVYQPLKTSITIPDRLGEGLLAGTYSTTTKFNFDGSLSSQSFPAFGNLPAETVSHSYDDFGRPLKTWSGTTGATVDYVTDTQDTRYGEAQRVQLGDAQAGKRVWVSYYFDDNARRLNRTIVDAEVSRPMQRDVHYTYDPAGNLTSIADTPQDMPADVQCFRYDYLRRLVDAWTPSNGCTNDPSADALAGPAPYWQSFTYDVIGNRRTEVRHASAGDTTRTYTYPNPGSARPHAVTAVSSTGPAGTRTGQFDYDAAGNTISRSLATGSQQLQWDPEGHLATVTEPGKTTEAVYGAAGSRLVRRDPTSTTVYLGSQELRLDKATGAVTGTRYYTHGGATIAVRTSAGLTWLAHDHHGTDDVAIDAATLATATRRLDPFGNPRGPQPAWPGDHGFVGGARDPSTGLTHLGAREYDPTTGKFISVDPIADSGNPQQMNGYAYANNNPTTWSDPTGLIINTRCPDGECPLGGFGGSRPKKPPSPAFSCCNVVTAVIRGHQNRTIEAYDRSGAYINGIPLPRFGVSPYGLAQRIDQYAPLWRKANHRPLGPEQRPLSQEDTLVLISSYCYKHMDFCGKELYAWAINIHFALLWNSPFKLGRPTYAGVLRTEKDFTVSTDAPEVKPTDRDISRSATQNQSLQNRLYYLRSLGGRALVYDERVNQQQVNAGGDRVGINQPDLQYTVGGGRRYEEYDKSSSNRGVPHAARILANDPASLIYLYTVD